MQDLIEKAFNEIKKIDTTINFKYSKNLYITGSKSCIDSVALLTFLITLENLIKKELKKDISFLDKNIFDYSMNIKFKDLIKFFK